MNKAFMGPAPEFDKKPKNMSLYKRIYWNRLIFTGVMPLMALVVGIGWVPLQLRTAIFTLIYSSISGIGITAGYHRYWSHRSYSATIGLKIALAVLGASAGEGTIRTWCKDHRAHHRYVDTDKDPYAIHKGFLYAHYGWVIIKRRVERNVHVDIQDLESDPIVLWQRRNYAVILFLSAFVFPILFCGIFFQDFLGGIIYGSCMRVFIVQQRTFCINSFAHWFGEKPFSGKNSPCDNFLVAVITLGEGYHNFHHEFPVDYRCGYHLLAYDPTKWFIWLCSQLNLAFDLKRFPTNEIKKGHFQQIESQLEKKRTGIDWGKPLDELPVISISKFEEYVRSGQPLISIDGVAHNVSDFVDHHPGGPSILRQNFGQDATRAFRGGLYLHSNAAQNLLSSMRFARVANDDESELGQILG
ncbi:hypothetical protein N7520_005823 [Penicillium odoratum]|uniref:uncharacterized protein n=1 Tax=Penicillium odoratum TaxID=1167516 RepID=UPI002547FD25|nr:uncharacterized protein N7520_005823 [Penicillium odoratum]KAJ5758667.1 hypothetical protein N7520_005823 [Penicillium odoratum]